MQEVIYSFAMSADGFIARPDGSFDWLDRFPADADFDFDSFLASLSGVVMGRGTYDVVRRIEPWGYAKFPCLVTTNRALPDAPPGTEAMAGEPAALLARLRAMGADGRVWILGGGVLARQFMDAGLLDVVEAGLIPVALGSGVPAFAPGPDAWLDLDFAKPLRNGAVHLRWQVRRPAPPDVSG